MRRRGRPQAKKREELKPKKVADPTIYLPASDNIDHRQLPYRVRDKLRTMNAVERE